MFIGPASAPGALIASVDAPWRTSTPGQSISAGVLALVVALSCAGGPNSQEFILSVMLSADAGCESDPTMMAAAAQMRVVKAALIVFPVALELLSAHVPQNRYPLLRDMLLRGLI